jgi:glucose/arabinose dehydrogenase
MSPFRFCLLCGVLCTASSSALFAQDHLGRLRLERVATGLSNPLYLTNAGFASGLVYIVEQRSGTVGRIRLLNPTTGELFPEPFLEVPNVRTGNEEGLLGLAFDPGFAFNNRFYVYYVTTDASVNPVAPHAVSVLERYEVSSDPRYADSSTATRLLVMPQPFGNHNGGWMGFGPDNYLYLSTGDGGSGNDPRNSGQSLSDNPSTTDANEGLLGKLLRLDVSGTDAFPDDPNRNYAIPFDNPFAAGGGAPEIWHYGLRNAWRCSFDRQSGDLYLADVGQSTREEINYVESGTGGGLNFGWRPREGLVDNPGVTDAAPADAVDPIYDYPRSVGRSVTGGYVYRGSNIPWLFGHYFFADFVSGWVKSFRVTLGEVQEETDWTSLLSASLPTGQSLNNPASFGEGPTGELYIVDLDGDIFRFRESLYDEWVSLNFTVQEIEAGEITRPDADPDNDSASNAVEFVGGGNPRSADEPTRPYPEIVEVDGQKYLSMVWEVDPAAAGGYSLSASPSGNLMDYTEQVLPVMEASATRYQVRDSQPIEVTGGRWLKIDVSVD